MGIPEAIIGSALLGIGGSIFSSSKQSDALDKSSQLQYDAQLQAMNAQTAATNRALAFQEHALAQQRADLLGAKAPAAGFINQGYGTSLSALKKGYKKSSRQLTEGFDSAEQRLTPLADPWALDIARGYFANPDEINRLPGVEWQREEGIRALQNAFSRTTGGGLSGDKMRAAEEFGQNYASTQLDNAINRLIPFINLSTQTTGALADMDIDEGAGLSSLTSAYAANKSALAQNQAAQLAGLEVSTAGGMANATGSMAPMISANLSNLGNIGANYAYGVGQIGANNAIGQANIGTNQAGYLTDLISSSLLGLAHNGQDSTQPQGTFTGQWWNTGGDTTYNPSYMSGYGY